MDPSKLDYSYLSHDFTPKEVTSYIRKQIRKSTVLYGIIAFFVVSVVSFMALAFTALVFPVLWMLFSGQAADAAKTVVFAICVLAVLGGAFYAIWKLVCALTEKRMRLGAFVTQNHLVLADGPLANQEPGMLFDRGHSKRFTGGFYVPGPGNILIANYDFTEGSGKNAHTYSHLVIRCDLSRRLPNVLLDATSNNFMKRFSNLGSFGGGQSIELEGDFNQYFSVHCPDGYGKDTLYWLTPELMQLLKQHMSTYDIEVVDNHVYAYSEQLLKFEEGSIKSTLQLANWLFAEFEENTHRYSDERVGSSTVNVVATQGQRLKKSVPVSGVIVVVVYLIVRLLIELRSN